DLSNDLDATGNLYQAAAKEDAKFSFSHPADLFRLKQHVALLKDIGWWDQIEGSSSHYVRLLSLAKTFPDAEFKVPGLTSIERSMLTALDVLMPAVVRAVNDIA